jgi:hypothetical protein
MSQATIVASNDTSVTLESKLDSGITMRRTIKLAPNRPELTILAEFINNSNDPREMQVQSHLCLDLGDVRTSRVRFTDRAGGTVDEDMTETIAGLREGKPFYRQKRPDGSWTFSGNKGFEVVQRFPTASVGVTRLCAYPADLNELEVELSGPDVVLQPGEAARLEHELETRVPGDANTADH